MSSPRLERVRCVLSLALFLACACGDSDATTVRDDAGDARDAASAPAAAPRGDAAIASRGDAARVLDAAAPCTPGEQRVDPCPQPDPRCVTGGGFSYATCQPDGTFGPCECMPKPGPFTPASAEDTAMCLEAAADLFTDACAQCICTDSKECTETITHCEGACHEVLQCLVPCLPDAGAADLDCVAKCLTAFPADALTTSGETVPGCAARCPAVCITGLHLAPVADADGGAD